MRLITCKSQSRVFKSLVEIIKVLATCEGDAADDAIGDVYLIAYLVGGEEMARIFRGGAEVRMGNVTLTKWSKKEMASYIRLLEEIIERERNKERAT